jgi:hypothetical protein
VFTTRFAGGRGGRSALEAELRRLGVKQKNGKPNHPQTQGKAERFQQTLKNWLRAQPHQPATLTELQALLGAFTSTYNTRRPAPLPAPPGHPRHCLRRPAQGRPRGPDRRHPRPRPHRPHRHRRKLTLRVSGKLHHIGIGREHARTPVLMLIQDPDVRIINAATGELIRELTINPDRNYQPTGRPPCQVPVPGRQMSSGT